MSTIMEQDANARQRILTDMQCNFFLEASAGSGKTTALVRRMAAMVESGISVREICAITFTKAAAKEFRSRFQKLISERIREEEYAAHRERYRAALRDIDLCFMGTIDSFSNMILHEHPVEAGINSDCGVCPASDAMPYLKREYARLCRGEYPALAASFRNFCCVQISAQNAFEGCIGSFLERREMEHVYASPASMDVNTPYTTLKFQIVSDLKMLLAHEEYVGTTTECKKQFRQLPHDIERLSLDWNDQIGSVLFILKELDGLRLGTDSSGKYLNPSEINMPYPELFEFHEGKQKGKSYYYLNLTDTDFYRTMKKLQYQATMEFMTLAAQEFSASLVQNGVLTFHDALIHLRDMLREDAKAGGRLIRHIAGRHRCYLVDEFQDTNPLQSEIIFYLTAQDPKPDWTACKPRPGSLFIVGDPKQSIYRFNGADIRAYLRVRQLFADGAGEVLTLSRNFRSTRCLREWFNGTFPSLLEEIPDVQSKFTEIPIPEDDTDAVTTGIYTYQVEGNQKALKADAARVTDVILRLVGNPAVRMKGGRAPEFRDIMVITRQKARTAQLAQTLAKAGIPCRTEGEIHLSECPALPASAALLGAAARPGDSLAVYTALRSAAFCIPDAELLSYCNAGGKLKLFTEPDTRPSGFTALTQALDTLHQLAVSAKMMSPSALYLTICEDTHLFARAGSAAMEYFCYAAELLRCAEAEGTVLTHADAADFLHDLLEADSMERCVSLTADENRVHIANLHKVKGLEAPIVILAYPLANPHDPNTRTVRSDETGQCWVFSLRNGNFIYGETDEYPAEFAAERQCSDEENKRLLYVAATRAENMLIVGDSVSNAAKSAGKRIETNPWAALLPPDHSRDVFGWIQENPAPVEPVSPRNDGEALYAQGNAASVMSGHIAAEPTFEITRPSQIKLRPVASDAPEDTPEPEHNDRNAALTGTLVHRLMERIVSGGVPEDAGALIESVLREYDADAKTYAKPLTEVLQSMTHGGYPQEDAVPEDLLRELASAEKTLCEVPFCYARGTELVHGIMDLIYCKAGAWHIVDYKTNAEQQQLAQKYAAQLAEYRAAFEKLTGQKADARIYHIAV